MSQTDRDYSEKRDFIRMTIEAKVTLHFKGLEFPGVCRDLSSNGMQIEAKAALAVGDTLNVHLPSPLAHLDPLNVGAEVVRVESLPDGLQILGLVTTPA
jgi:hypothetical protein